MPKDITEPLRRPRRPVRTALISVGVAALIGAGAFGTSVLAPLVAPAPVETVTPGEEFPEPLPLDPLPTETPAPTPTEEPVVEVPAPPPPPAPPAGPTLCPPGTVPGAVDDNGNESNCAPPCNAYNDENVCIGAPAPGRREDSA